MNTITTPVSVVAIAGSYLKMLMLCMLICVFFFVPLIVLLINNLMRKPYKVALPRLDVEKQQVPALRLKI